MALTSLYREPEAGPEEIEWPALQLNDVFRIYRSGPVETVALRGVSLQVERGELVAILGPSGCGKSTLLALAAGLDRPSAGEVRAFGDSLALLSDAQLADYRARQVGIVFQSGNLWETLTARENVAVALRLAGCDRPRERALKALADFGLRERSEHRVGALSGGEQQRVAIAAAVARQAPLVIADEPTGELDAANERIVLDTLSRLPVEHGCAVLVVTHSRRGRRRGSPHGPAARRAGGPVSTSSATVDTELASCRGVSVFYGRDRARVTALADVDLTLLEGEALALLGPSGSGKTTLLHVLGGLVVPNAGSVLWKGQQLSSLDAAARGRARAAGIAYVFQGSNLLPTFTAYENVAFAAWVATRHQSAELPATPHMRVEELLELVGLSEKLDALPADLSGGEAQRVAIARALAQAPQLLLCDEPTGHLDSDTAGRVLDLIVALRERFGFALSIATHDPQVASRCARSVRLADGRLEEEQT